MSHLPEDVKHALMRERLELLRRETATLRDARRILADLEASGTAGERIRKESRRAVELAVEVQRLGIVDARRVGADMKELAEATGMDAAELAGALHPND